MGRGYRGAQPALARPGWLPCAGGSTDRRAHLCAAFYGHICAGGWAGIAVADASTATPPLCPSDKGGNTDGGVGSARPRG